MNSFGTSKEQESFDPLAAEATLPDTPKQLNLLIIEDDKSYLYFVRQLLQPSSLHSYSTKAAGTLAEAVAILQSEEVDIILADLNLPDAHGLNILNELQKYASEKPLVILTASDNEALAVQAVKLGAQDYLVKQKIDKNQLIRSLNYSLERKQIQNALRDSERRFRDIVTSIPGVVYQFLVDKDGKRSFPYVSSAALTVLGVPAEVIIADANNFFGLVVPEDQKRLEESIFESIANASAWKSEFRIRPKNGQIRWITASSNASTLGDGSICWNGVAFDTTERVIAEEMMLKAMLAEENITKEILGQAPIGIWKLDENLAIADVNAAGVEQMGIHRAQLLGKDIFEFVLDYDKAPAIEALRAGHPYKVQDYKLNPERLRTRVTTFWDWVVWPIWSEDNWLRGAIVLTQEVTERVRLGQEREDFMATLAHDLKTPLIGADRALGLLLDGVLEKLEPGQAQIVAMLKKNNQSLLTMVQDLLEVYRYETASRLLNFQLLDLTQLVTSCIEEILPLANGHHLKVKSNLPVNSANVQADKQAIRRLLMNLLENSIKFTPAEGQIEVSVAGGATSVVIKVKDTGAGIAKEDQPKLFERFWQGSDSQKYAASTGLGLYLCRQIVEAHHGQIRCESEGIGGSTFIITLPITQKILDEDNVRGNQYQSDYS